MSDLGMHTHTHTPHTSHTPTDTHTQYNIWILHYRQKKTHKTKTDIVKHFTPSISVSPALCPGPCSPSDAGGTFARFIKPQGER